MADLTFRAATVEDAALLAQIGAQAFENAFGMHNTPEDMQAYLHASFSPQIQAHELAEPGAFFLIAELDGNAAGYAHLRIDPPPTCITGSNPIHLERFYLIPNLISKGYGSQLMQACLDESRGRGGDVIWLGVWHKNERAIKFYQKWGFTIVGDVAFQLGSDLQTDFLMQRSLG